MNGVNATKESSWITRLFLTFFVIYFFTTGVLAVDTFRLTPYQYAETEDLSAAVKSLFGENAVLADWNDIKNYVGSDLKKLVRFYQLIGLQDQKAALVNWNGEGFWSGTDRHYFIQRFDNGAPIDFLAHDQIGSLYLGSWYGITMNALAKTYQDTSFYRLTPGYYDETGDFNAILESVFGWGASLVDWNDLKVKIGDDTTKLAEFYRQIGLKNEGAAWVCVGGEQFYSENRHYFIERFDEGKPLGFLAHDQMGSLYLGSWYGININILARTRTTFTALKSPGVPLPQKIQLRQNYPNPFNPVTTIEFTLPAKQHVNLTIYNATGQEVATLISGEMNAGTHRVEWQGGHLPSGVYFYRLKTAHTVLTRKMLLLK